MTTDPELQKLAERAQRDYESGSFESAAQAFESAARGHAALGHALRAAEMKNNMSVAFLRAGRAQEALQAALGTEEVFAGARDLKRQGMALGNQAAALEALRKLDEALALYERSAGLFAAAGAGDLRSMVLQSAAAIKLKRGRLGESAFQMIGSLEAKDRPSALEWILKYLLGFMRR
jgi:tetratricopeptide (TPR) repeat protein